MANSQKITVEISPKSVIVAIGIIALTYFLFLIRNILAMVLIAFIISAAFSPLVNFFTAKKIPKGLAILIVYLFAFIVTFSLLSIISVPIAKEILRLINSLPNTISSLLERLDNFGISENVIGTSQIKSTIELWASDISQNLGNIVTAGTNGLSGIVNILTNLFGGIVSFISVIALAIYISLDKDDLYHVLLLKIADEKTTKKFSTFISDVEKNLGSWFVGQTFLSFVIGVLAITVYSIIGLPFAGSIALLTAFLNIIPNLGPVIAFVPAFILALSTGNPFTIIGCLIGSIAIQQLEGNILAPKILSNAVGLPPILILLSILIGAQLFGITGVILAVPVSVIAHLLITFLSKED
ncbi:MAG: AI-2E family transporter [bacterium]